VRFRVGCPLLQGRYGADARQGDTRATVCVSSQVGCKMGCKFCATGTMGMKERLTAPFAADLWTIESLISSHLISSHLILFYLLLILPTPFL
jgi:hypothetical protein